MKSNALFITWDVPYPAVSGGKKATLSIVLENLTGNNCSAILVINSKGEKDELARDYFLKSNISIESITPSYSLTRRMSLKYCTNYIRSFGSFKPYFAQKYFDQSIIKKIEEIISRDDITEIYFNSINFGELFSYFKKRYDSIKYYLVVHNIEHVLLGEFSSLSTNIASKISYRLESLKMRYYERKMLSCFDRLLFVSSYDIDKMKKYLVPDLQDINCWSQQLSIDKIIHKGGGGYILFPGSIDFPPNMHGLSWFCKNINHRISCCFPDVKIIVTSTCSKKNREKFTRFPNIIFTGFVDDTGMIDLYEKCICIISPILKGSGVKIKAIEAIHNKIPIVMTGFSMQGVVLDRDDSVGLSDNPRDFYSNLVKVINANN